MRAKWYGDPTREAPFFFMKPADALQVVPQGEIVDHPDPAKTQNHHFELEPGDVIFSGTPDRVGAVTQGQTMVGAIQGLGEIRLRVV
jgi:2-keto-4-pentenoate hydratase/2-oxohepta-3-ene-1,7-dioic acid hydratase in catechol pathway